jgi:hypothetical protein
MGISACMGKLECPQLHRQDACQPFRLAAGAPNILRTFNKTNMKVYGVTQTALPLHTARSAALPCSHCRHPRPCAIPISRASWNRCSLPTARSGPLRRRPHSRSAAPTSNRPTPSWAETPDAVETIQRLLQEFEQREGRKPFVRPPIRPDVTAANSMALRNFVQSIVTGRAAGRLPFGGWWKKRFADRQDSIEAVHRVYGDLLQDPATLQRTEEARETLREHSKRQSSGGDSLPQSRALRALFAVASFFRLVLQLLIHSLCLPLWIPWPRFWGFNDLLGYAEALPFDADVQLALLKRLNDRGHHSIVLARVQSGRFATSPACEAEYLRAVVESSAIHDLRGPGPPRKGLHTSSLSDFLRDVQDRLAAAAGSKPQKPVAPVAAPVAARATDTQLVAPAAAVTLASPEEPLRVRLENAQPHPFLAAVRGVVSFLSTLFVVICLWVLGATVEGTVRTVASTAPSDGVASGSMDKGAFAPKEYSKDSIPESLRKTFADVKGCEEAKEELKVRSGLLRCMHASPVSRVSFMD